MIFQFTGTDTMNTALNQMASDGRYQRQYFSPYGGIFTALAHKPAFNGERCDPLTGATHLGNGYRAYNPVLMRFHCPDSMSPFGAGGINTYAYCSGDPINNSDPSGHMSAQAGGGISLGVLGLALGTAMFGVSIAAKVAVVASVAAIGTGIASAATEESNPEASTVLGWVSAGLGIVGAAFGVKGIHNLRASTKSNMMGSTKISHPMDLRYNLDALLHNQSPETLGLEVKAFNDASPRYLKVQSLESLASMLQDKKSRGKEFKFIVDKTRQLHVSEYRDPMKYPNFGHIAHPSILEANGVESSQVLSAGYIKVYNSHRGDGYLFEVNNRSGHYKPPAASLNHLNALILSMGGNPVNLIEAYP